MPVSRRRILASFFVSLLWLLPHLAGCAHWHGDRNAPGHVVLTTPPRHIECEGEEEPNDPGERIVLLAPGAFMGGGYAHTAGGGVAGSMGVEASLHVGSAPSHFDDQQSPPIGLPRRSLGINLGWAGMVPKVTGVLYAELQGRLDQTAIAPGWAWDPSSSRHGPQATLALGPLYLRGTYLSHSRLDITLGVFVKALFAWIWSR
jgi:hypothetical protein